MERSGALPAHTVSTVLSPVYGPVDSWRFGRSLGIDLLLRDSICSFQCIYCQLGRIRQLIDRQDVFVPTERIVAALREVDWGAVDTITFSGNGEPTLARNLGQAIAAVRRVAPDKIVTVLTNSTWLFDPQTRARLRHADVVECKLDTGTDQSLRRINQPASGVALHRILAGIEAMREEPGFTGRLTLQIMLMRANLHELDVLFRHVVRLQPHEVHLNTPSRPRPREWTPEARGNRSEEDSGLKGSLIAPLSRNEMERAAARLGKLYRGPVLLPPQRP